MVARKVNGAWYVDAWIDVPGRGRERIRKRSPIQTKKGTEQYEVDLIAAALSGNNNDNQPPEERRSFEDFAVEFLERHVRVQCKYSTLVTYECSLREHLVPFFKDRTLETINERDIAALQTGLVANGKPPKSVRNIVGVLAATLRMACEWKYIEASPRIRHPKAGLTRFRFLSHEDCRALEEEGSTPYWFAMIHVARKAGLRIGELMALEREQVNVSRKLIRVDRAVWRKKVSTPKHGRVRTVEISTNTAEVLREEIDRLPKGATLVFPSTLGNRMRGESKCDLGLRRCAKRAGLEPFGWHVLRHTYASHLMMAGVALPVVQELLGHSDIRITMRYAHLSPGHRASAVEHLDREGQEDRVGNSWAMSV
jgi:integrase